MSDHLKGLLITTLGVLLVVPDSLFVRLIGGEPMVNVFWRGLVAGVLIIAMVIIFEGPSAFRAAARAGWPAAIYCVLLGTTTFGFVMAITHTSVANAVFIFASTPVFAAVFSRIFLKEPIRRRIVWTMVFVMAGLGIIAYGSGESSVASWKGDLWALYVSAAFAGALTAVRRAKDISLLPVVPVSFIGAALCVALFFEPFQTFAVNWPLFLAHGAFIGAATWFLTQGPRYISSAEVSLLILLESVLAPILVWMVIGEDPGIWALVGGVVVIGALVISNLIALRGSDNLSSTTRTSITG